jgi:prolipoprotein diacylglyceryltransferase
MNFKNILLTLFGLNVYLYGVGVFIAISVAVFLFWRNIRRTAHNEEKLMDALFAASVMGFIFSRVGYIIYHWADFSDNLLKGFLLFTYPGIVELAFFIGLFLSFALYSIRHKIAFDNIIKLLALPVIAGRGIIELFSLVLSNNLFRVITLVFYTVSVIVFLYLYKRLKDNKSFQVVLKYLLFTALAIPAFIVDFFTDINVYFLSQKLITVNQALNLGVIVISTLLLVKVIMSNK